MLDITHNNIMISGVEWYNWQYLRYLWSSCGIYNTLRTNMQDMLDT